MKFNLLKITLKFVVFSTLLLISCEDNSKILKEINADRQDPIGTAKKHKNGIYRFY